MFYELFNRLILDYFSEENDYVLQYPQKLKEAGLIEESDMLQQFINIVDETFKYNINSADFINLENLGFRGNTLVFFDIGFGNFFDNEEFDMLQLNNFDDTDIFKKLKIKKHVLLGEGAFGRAYDISNNKVLKITKDVTEAKNSLIISNKLTTNLTRVDIVYKVKNDELYIIIMEKLDTSRYDYLRTKIYNIEEFLITITNYQHIPQSKIDEVKNPVVREFIKYMITNGPTKTWNKFFSIFKKTGINNEYDFNDIEEICKWIVGSKTNHNKYEHTPDYILEEFETLLE